MSEPGIHGAAGPIQGPGAIGPLPEKARPSSGGPAFRALLERLETQARELSSTERIEDAGELAGAVEHARHALEDALSLGDRLLEAYRAATTRGGGTPPQEDAA